MHIKLTIPYGKILIVPATQDAGPLLTAIAQGQVFEEPNSWDKEKVYKLAAEQVQIELLKDDFSTEVPDPIKVMQEKVKASEAQWMSYYNKANEAEKKVKELEAKLAKFTDVAKEV